MIVLIEDDQSICKLVQYALEMNGFSVSSFSRAEEFYEKKVKDVSLYILDIMLPGISGIEVLERIRKNEKENVPVIMLTAKSEEYDIVLALDKGADDYITKPFGILELIGRVKALLRRSQYYEGKRSKTLTSSHILLSAEEHRVYTDGNEVFLTPKEYDLLDYLMRNEGIALSRETLLFEVWGYTTSCLSRTVDVHIKHLRERLGERGSSIETVKGIGYRFNGGKDEE